MEERARVTRSLPFLRLSNEPLAGSDSSPISSPPPYLAKTIASTCAAILDKMPVTTSYIMSKYKPMKTISVDSGMGSTASSRTESSTGPWVTSSSRSILARRLLIHKRLLQGYSGDSDAESRVTESPSTTDSESVSGEPSQTVLSRTAPFMMGRSTQDLIGRTMEEVTEEDLPLQKKVDKIDLFDMNMSMLPLNEHVPMWLTAPPEQHKLVQKTKHTRSVKTPEAKSKALRDFIQTGQYRKRFGQPKSANVSVKNRPSPERKLPSIPEDVDRGEDTERIHSTVVSSENRPQLSQEGRSKLIGEDMDHETETIDVSGENRPSTEMRLQSTVEDTDSASSTSSTGHVETRKRRFIRTRDALEKSGLLDITMKTAKLIQENTCLQSEIDSLKQQTKDFIEDFRKTQSISGSQSQITSSTSSPWSILPKQEPSD